MQELYWEYNLKKEGEIHPPISLKSSTNPRGEQPQEGRMSTSSYEMDAITPVYSEL